MQNPLLSNNIITTIDTFTNTEIIVDIMNIGKYFKYVYCLAPFNIFDYSILKNKTVNIIEYNKVLSKMILYKTKITLLKNTIHFGNIMYIEKEYIINANHLEYNMDEKILIIPFFNITFLNLQKYINGINGENTLDKLYNMKVLYDYFGEKSDKLANTLCFNNIIKSLHESSYWKHEYNCMCNITKLFVKRDFNFSILKKSSDDTINKIISNIHTTKLKENYLEEIFKKKNYVDPSSVINKKGFHFYNIIKSCKYKSCDIVNLLDNLTMSQKMLLFVQLGISKDYCHLVINNEKVLDLITKDINKYINLYEYVFGYAWIRFYFEECIKKFNMKTTDMFIFDINTASKLPVFHFDYNNPHSNPYMPILVGNHSLHPSSNIGGINIGKSIEHRICNLDEFRERLNIFTTNNNQHDLFKGIDFKKYKMGITGSIMTACLQYKHPLLKLFETKNITMNDLYNRFFNEYYCNADIDVMILTTNMIEFLDIGRDLHQDITNNILSLYAYSEPAHVKLIPIKQIYLFVTSDFIKNNIMDKITDILVTYEMIICNLHSPHVIKLFDSYGQMLHQQDIDKFLLEYTLDEQIELKIKYPEYFEYKQEYLVVKLYNIRVNATAVQVKSQSEYTEEQLEKIMENVDDDIYPMNSINIVEGASISTSFKFKISAPQLDHVFEIFPIKKDDFMTTVGSFHMPCVRAYYDGMNVFMTPSCISAHLTYMNIDYKYFAGSKDPLEIINKYRMRGFGTWLNRTEINTFIKYSSMVPFWNNLYNINLNSKNIADVLGSLSINNKLFYPRQFNMDYFIEPQLKPIPFDEPYVTVNHEETYNNECYNNNRFKVTHKLKKYQHIDCNTGYINIIEPNFIDNVLITL